MGFFTWTLANKNNKCSAGYGGQLYVLCPDDTFIKEPYYDGYGKFGGQDIYELVVDWNRKYLDKIFAVMHARASTNGEKGFWGENNEPIAIAAMKSDAEAAKVAKAAGLYPVDEWKRLVGITIACEHNDWIPYPIKIVSHKQKDGKKFKYSDLPPSISTQ